MKYKLPKFLTEAKKIFLIHNTESLFVQYTNRFLGDRFVCVYMSDEKFERCHYDHNNTLVIEYYICESQFKSLYRKFLDNEIECFNYEDIKNGCNKFYLISGKEYKKFIRILLDM